MKKLLFIMNPFAGQKKANKVLPEILMLFTEAGYEINISMTTGPGAATRIAAEQGGNVDLVVCCGGDGTLNEVVTGLLRHEEEMPLLGYLPAGTTNDFAKTLKIPAALNRSTEIAMGGTPALCDVGDFNGSAFIYVAAFGVFTEVSYATPQTQKNALGRVAYLLEGIKSLSQLKPYHMVITHDGETIEDDFIYGMVSDSISVGGFRGIKEDMVKLDDGLFEVMLVKNPRTLEEVSAVLNAILTQKPHDRVLSFQTGEIKFACTERVAWTLDGEFGGDTETALIKNRTRAIKIMRG